MAHEIDESTGKAAMAYVGEKPWHGLGQALTPDADLDTWRVEAGMDWNILAAPVLFDDRIVSVDAEVVETVDSTIREMRDRQVFFRSDTRAALSVVSNDFKIVQPYQILEFYRDLVGNAGFQLETAGCLFGGKKFWALAKCGENAKIMGQDEVAPYLLLASACDGSMSTVAHYTSVRVVCNNTLRMAVGANAQKAQIKIPHSATFNETEVKLDLGIAADTWEKFIVNMNVLAAKRISRDDAIDFTARQLKKEWPNKEGGAMDREEMLSSSMALRRIIKLFDGEALGSQMDSANGTAWGLVNAMTQYFDHESGSKGEKSRAFERAHLTDRASFKVRFVDELLAA